MSLKTGIQTASERPGLGRALEVLLVCGVLSSLLYVCADLFASFHWEGYSYAHQSYSELLAIGAPTRAFMIPLSVVYNALVIAFAAGVWGAAGGKRRLRIAAVLLFAYGTASLVGPFVPMQQRGSEMALTDVLHIVCTVVIVLSSLLAMGFGAAAFGKRFRVYSIAAIATVTLFGVLAGMQGSRIAEGLPTPWVGVVERANIYSIMLWVLVLAVAVLRARSAEAPPRRASAPGPSILLGAER